jgi:hypothetical protein
MQLSERFVLTQTKVTLQLEEWSPKHKMDRSE